MRTGIGWKNESVWYYLFNGCYPLLFVFISSFCRRTIGLLGNICNIFLSWLLVSFFTAMLLYESPKYLAKAQISSQNSSNSSSTEPLMVCTVSRVLYFFPILILVRGMQIQWNSVNSTSDYSKTCLTQTKFRGPCLGNGKLLGISRTFSHNSNW